MAQMSSDLRPSNSSPKVLQNQDKEKEKPR